MSNIDATTAAVIDAEFEAIVAQPEGLSIEALAEAKANAIADIVDESATLDTHKAASGAAISGYEASFKGFLTRIVTACKAGAQHKEIADALKADNSAATKRGESKPHTWTAAGSISNFETVGFLFALEGDLPAGYVWRVAKDDTISLQDGEKSVTDLVVSVVRPTDSTREALRAWAKEQGIKPESLYGKKVVESIIDGKTSIEDAVETLEKTAKHHAAIARKHKAMQEALAKAAEAAANATEEEEAEEEAEVAPASAEALLEQAIALLVAAAGAEAADTAAYAALAARAVEAAQAL